MLRAWVDTVLLGGHCTSQVASGLFGRTCWVSGLPGRAACERRPLLPDYLVHAGLCVSNQHVLDRAHVYTRITDYILK
jgi:hypothetical protein